MPKVAPRSRSYPHPDFERLFAEAGHDLSKVVDVYARISRATDERFRNTEGQVGVCVDHLLEAGLVPGMIHVDDSVSAWNEKIIRPAWDNVMDRLEGQQTGGIMMWNLTRFARRVRDGERLVTAAEKTLLIIDSDGKYDLTNPTHKRNFRAAIIEAAYYSDQLAKNVQRGKLNRAKQGDSNTAFRPFGFEPDGTVRESEAEIIRELTRRLLAGESQNALIEEMNARGVKSSRGYTWCRSTLRNLMTRELNAGRVRYKTEIVATRPGKPIVDPADFDLVCSSFNSRKRGKPAKYLLAGFLQCGHCEDRKMYGRPYPKNNPYPDGSVRRAYTCGFSCYQAIDMAMTDETAKELALDLLSDPKHAAKIEGNARRTGAKAAELTAEIERYEGMAEDLAAKTIEWGMKRVDAATKPIDAKLVELRRQRAALPTATQAVALDARASRTEWEKRWQAADIERRRAILTTALGGRMLVVARGSAMDFDATRITRGK